MNNNSNNIYKTYKSHLKDKEEHGYEGYTDNMVSPKVITTFGASCSCRGKCGCEKRK